MEISQINVIRGFQSIICNESCQHENICANHKSMGDVKSNTKMKPTLSMKNGNVYCHSKNDKLALNSSLFGEVFWKDII